MLAVASIRSRIAVACLLLFCAALLLSAYSAKHPQLAQAGSVVVGEGLRPLQRLLRGVSSGASGWWQDYVALVHLRQEHELLEERFRKLEVENSRLLEWGAEIKRLRALWGIAGERGYHGVAAEVVGQDPSNWSRVVVLDRGSSEGLGRGMPVIVGDAVVGQIINVSPSTSRVLLITDHSSGVDSIVQSSRVRGVVQGDGHADCALQYVPQEDEVTLGDRIITSGMDGVYPKGLLVGVVSSVSRKGTGMFQLVAVKPAVDFSRLETVLVLRDSYRESSKPAEASQNAGGAKP